MSLFIADAVAQTTQAAPAGQNPIMTFVMLGGLFAFMYFVIIRPQKKRQKEHQQLTESLAKGNEVVMSSGLIGKIVDVDGDYVSISAADSVVLKFQKSAVHAVLPKGTIKSL